MASVKFFWETLQYEMEKRYNGENIPYESPYKNGCITIHKVDDDVNQPHYTIYKEGLVIQDGSCDLARMNIIDIIDDDAEYEPYSPVQVIKSGYLEFLECDKSMMLRKLAGLYDIIYHLYEDGKTDMYPFSSWWCNGKLTAPFHFNFNNVEVHLNDIGDFAKENANRVKYGLKPFPYNSKIPENKNWLKLRLVTNVECTNEVSVKDQLDAIRFITDNIDGVVFHDDYIRHWMW